MTQARDVILALLAALLSAPASRAADDPAGVAFFEQSIRPLLSQRCYSCHSATAKKLKSGLLLDSRAGWARGGEKSGGPVIVPGKPDESLLIQAVRYEHGDLKMPPEAKLPQAEIGALVKWAT